MANVYGTVLKQFKDQRTSKAGKQYGVEVIVVKANSGEEVNLESGFKRLPVDVGAFYEFECEKNYGKWNIKTFNKTSADSAQASAPALSSGSSFKGKVFPVPVDHPDRSIIRQNSLAHATRLLDGELDDDDFDALADKVIALARRFEAYSSGDLEVAEAERLASED